METEFENQKKDLEWKQKNELKKLQEENDRENKKANAEIQTDIDQSKKQGEEIADKIQSNVDEYNKNKALLDQATTDEERENLLKQL